ncbi:MAG: hypothetical protein JWR90_2370 [Marmoricola sp.]|nr:hypothetical protein [Marmoricola sp.]
MTSTPEPAFGSSVRKPDQVPWWWQLLDADGRVISVEERTEFPTRSDAETWLGEAYPDLFEDGVVSVTLFEGDREVYGPMSLEAG